MKSGVSATWHIDEHAFPTGGEPWEQLGFLLQYAVLAPSGHNTQPWRFKVAEDAVEIHADRTRALPVVDAHDRELIMSCGAALFHLRVAIRYFGCHESVDLFPDPACPDLLARVRLGGAREREPADLRLFSAIPKRRTNREPFEPVKIGESVLIELITAAQQHGARLHVAREEHMRHQLAELVWHGDRAQMGNPSFRRELAAWIHPARAATHDGIPAYAMRVSEILDFATPVFATVLRTFDLGKGIAATDRKLAEGSPVLALLESDADDPAAWLAAGEALDHVLLEVTAHGVAASFLNQPIEVEPLRAQLKELMQLRGHPQVLLRLGYGPELKPTPRRGVRDVLL